MCIVTHTKYLISNVSYAIRTFWYKGSAGHGGGAWYRGAGEGNIYIYMYMHIVSKLAPAASSRKALFRDVFRTWCGVVFVRVFRGMAVMGSSFQCKMQCNAMQCILLLILII